MRKFLREILLIISSIVVVFVAPASTYALTPEQMEMFAQNNILFYDPGNEETSCASSAIDGNKVTVIGDSISVGAKAEYASQIPNADFESKTYNGTTYNLIEVSKHFASDVGTNYAGMTIANVLQEQGTLKPYLVFALGTNDAGAVTDASIESLMNLVGTNHKVVLVTNYALNNELDFSKNNAAIRAAASKYSNVAVADWAKEVDKNPTAYIEDTKYFVHPNTAGSQLFVKLIKQALDSLSDGTNGVSTGGNRNYAGAQVWSDAEIQAIEANQAIYKEAADKYNFPWQVLAVLHSHETGLRRYNPDNGQGVYQLYSYTDGGKNANRFEPAASISEEEFRRQTFIAAEFVTNKVGDLSNPDNIKKLFFQYNGTAQVYIDKAIAMGFTKEQAENGEGSAYVMNRYDERRDPTSSNMSSLWPGRFTGDGKYNPSATSNGFGAFVQYEALAGELYCSSAGGSIVETAIKLSWDGTGIHDKNDPKPEYVEAMKKIGYYQKGNGSYPEGASCDQFVGTVMRYSGADPEFPVFFGYGLVDYLKTNTDMYMKVDHHDDVANLQPGDIFITYENGNHIYLYLGEIDGKQYQASASANDRTGERFPSVYFSDSYGKKGDKKRYYEVYRRINY